MLTLAELERVRRGVQPAALEILANNGAQLLRNGLNFIIFSLKPIICSINSSVKLHQFNYKSHLLGRGWEIVARLRQLFYYKINIFQ